MSRLRNKALSIGIAYLAITLITAFSAAVPVKAEAKLLSIDKAVSLGLDNDTELNKLKSDRLKAENQLAKALKLLADFRRKDAETAFPLPISLELPIKDAKNKALTDILKIPQLRSLLPELDKKIADMKRKTETNIRRQYLSVYFAQTELERLNGELEEDKAAFEKLSQKFKTGRITADEFKEANNDLKSLEAQFQSAQKALIKHRNTLDALINFKLDDSYTFETVFTDVDLSEALEKELYASVAANDAEIYTAVRDLNRCRLGTSILLQDAGRQFGGAADTLAKLVNTKANTDIKALTAEYDKLYVQFSGQFKETYYLPFGMFYIRLDKDWAGEQLSGVLYFDNSDKGLVLAATEKENMVKNLSKVKNEQFKTLENMLIDIKELKKSCLTAEKAVQSALKAYEKAQSDSRLGKITSDKLLAAKKALSMATGLSAATITDYNKMLYSLDYETSGALGKYLWHYTISLEDIKKGLTFSKKAVKAVPAEPHADEGQWYIRASADGTGAVFCINRLPKGADADEYELYDSSDRLLVKRLKLKEQLAVPVQGFNGSALLRLQLYKAGKLTGIARLDGFESSGSMTVLTPPPPERKDK